MKILVVGGTFDNSGGKASSIVNLLIEGIKASAEFDDITTVNGGAYKDLDCLEPEIKGSDAILWFPNVSNDLPKNRDIKGINRKAILVTSKRNTEDQYAFQDIMARALASKSNLIIEFKRNSYDQMVEPRLLDPLGNQWFSVDSSADFREQVRLMGIAVSRRIVDLCKITRESTNRSDATPPILPDSTDIDRFLATIKSSAETFSDLIRPANGITRYLGNASFRCERGFPSIRAGKGIFVSRRNVDKSHITKDAFVFVERDEATSQILYHGEHKPSVDTPVQLKLYELLPRTNYMLHSHVYVAGAPFSSKMIPCGGLEEVREIAWLLGKFSNPDSFAVNLIGHGSIIFVSRPEYIDAYKFYARPRPEVM